MPQMRDTLPNRAVADCKVTSPGARPRSYFQEFLDEIDTLSAAMHCHDKKVGRYQINAAISLERVDRSDILPKRPRPKTDLDRSRLRDRRIIGVRHDDRIRSRYMHIGLHRGEIGEHALRKIDHVMRWIEIVDRFLAVPVVHRSEDFQLLTAPIR